MNPMLLLLILTLWGILITNLYQIIHGERLERKIKDRLIREQFAKLSRVNLKPSDTIVVHSPRQLPERILKHIRESMERYFPGRKCLIFEEGVLIKTAEGQLAEKEVEDGNQSPGSNMPTNPAEYAPHHVSTVPLHED